MVHFSQHITPPLRAEAASNRLAMSKGVQSRRFYYTVSDGFLRNLLLRRGAVDISGD